MENTINIEFNENATTQQRLLKATRVLIAKYGYDAMSTRMIANTAKVTLSAINFHFGSKEQLTVAAMQHAADKLEKAYRPLADEVRSFLSQTPVDRAKAWEYIDRFLEERIKMALSSKNWINIGLAEHESGLPEKAKGLVSKVAIEQSEGILAELIMAVSDKKDITHAAVMARTICAGMMSYMEKPLLWQFMAEKTGTELNSEETVYKYMHDYYMHSISVNVMIHPL